MNRATADVIYKHRRQAALARACRDVLTENDMRRLLGLARHMGSEWCERKFDYLVDAIRWRFQLIMAGG